MNEQLTRVTLVSTKVTDSTLKATVGGNHAACS
jgi:hypothetical protein